MMNKKAIVTDTKGRKRFNGVITEINEERGYKAITNEFGNTLVVHDSDDCFDIHIVELEVGTDINIENEKVEGTFTVETNYDLHLLGIKPSEIEEMISEEAEKMKTRKCYKHLNIVDLTQFGDLGINFDNKEEYEDLRQKKQQEKKMKEVLNRFKKRMINKIEKLNYIIK